MMMSCSRLSGKSNSMSGEEAAQQKLRCFPDILDIVFRLSDGKWRTLMRDLSNEVSTLQFASLCTHVVVSAAKSAIQSYRPALTGESESMSLSGESSSTDSTAPSSRSSAERSSETLAAKHLHSAGSQTNRLSQIYDLTISCTNDVIGGIISLYQSDISHSDGLTTAELSVGTNQTLHVMQELEKIIRSFRGSSKRCLKLKHLEESDETSFAQSVSEGNDVPGFHSSHQTESLFSDRLHDKAIHAVSDALLKTCEKMSSTVSNPSMKTSKSVTSQSDLHITSDTSFPSELYVHSAASDIMKTLMKGLHRMSSSQVGNGSVTEPSVPAKNLRSAALRLYRNVHHKVFGLLLRLKESRSAEEESVQHATSAESETHIQMLHSSFHTDDSDAAPKQQVDIDSCTDETVHNILDLYKNEVQLTESAPSEDDEVISSDCVSVLNQPEGDTSTVPSEILLNTAIELVRDVLLKSAQTACCTLSQRDSFTGSSSSSATPESPSRDLRSAAAGVAGSVVDALDSYVESKHPALTPVNSSSDELSCPDDPVSHVEDLQSLLENSEQTESETTDDVSVRDVKSTGASSTPSSKAGTAIMKDTLENLSISSQETNSSSSSPLNEPEPVVMKKRSHRFNFFVGKKAPFISFGQKKSTKACPAGEMSDSGQCASSSGNQQSSQRESTVRPSRKTRKCLSRILAAVRRALPNPFQCITRPS